MVTQEAGGSPQSSRLTARGAATRDRIVHEAADLMYVKGVNATTLDDVIAASGASKSNLYRRSPSRETVPRGDRTARSAVDGGESERLERLDSYRGLVRWRDLWYKPIHC